MRISAIDIKKQEFKKSFRGYDVGEVEAYLDTVANQFENLWRENENLKEQLLRVEEEMKELDGEIEVYRENEKTFQKAIVKSQDMAEEVLENAKKRAELITKEAEILVSKTKLTAQEEFVNLKTELEELRVKNESIIDEIKNFLIEKLNTLEEYSRNRKILRLESSISTLNEVPRQEKDDVPPNQFNLNVSVDDSNG
ncbi:MAG TPA: DivIVA domain-containing protein [Ignavibacteria bacterium]|nr:DivIVA domain-containing protein [Ignavibacteria bacterium]